MSLVTPLKTGMSEVAVSRDEGELLTTQRRARLVYSPCVLRRSQSESARPEIGTLRSMSGEGKRSVAAWPKPPVRQAKLARSRR